MIDLRDLTVPVIAAPMAGGPSTPALASAVSAAGGLGFLAAGYKTADAVAAEIDEVRSATTEPIGVNLFVLEPYDVDQAALDGYRRSLELEAARLRAGLGELRWDDDDWAAKLEVVLDLRPEVVSFTFGCPSPEMLQRLADRGILTNVTVTTADEAREAVARGAASLAAQGPHAGAHRGTWDLDAAPGSTALADLVAAVVSMAEVPVAAGGGIHDTAGVRALLGQGAVAAQVGTAYLLADEAGTNSTHRAALVDPGFDGTALTRAFTGRWARGIANRFMADHADAPAGYPQINHLTAPLRRAAVAAGDVHATNLWAGTGYRSARSAPAAEITADLAPDDVRRRPSS